MSLRQADGIGSTAGPWVLAAAVLATAALAGMVTAVIGSLAGYRSLYYIAVFGLVVLGGIVAATRAEPLRFVFLVLIVSLPVANALVPPGRFGLTVFDVVTVALAIGLIGKKLSAPSGPGKPFFPTRSLLLAWLLAVPSVVFSQFPVLSLEIFILIAGIYAFFLFTLDELKRDGGFERLVLLWSILLIVMAAGLYVDKLLHVNLSLRGSNLNQLSYIGGVEIRRAGGFFQDPQRAGAFLASMITFLLVLAVRGRFRSARLNLLVWTAIVTGSGALVTTISRGAILAGVSASALALFAFNRWNPAVKLMIMGGVVIAATIIVLTPLDTWLNVLPAAVAERFVRSRLEFEDRIAIWFDTWSMFADHPLTGIGLGSFRPFLMETRPTVFNYYGIGEAAGVAYIPDQPESGYLKILYEGGVIGSVAALLVAGDAVRRAMTIIAGRATNSDARTEAIAALAGLVTFGATFITLFTVSDARMAAIFAFFLAVIWHRSLQHPRVAPIA